MNEKDGKENEKERFLLEEAEKISEITSYMMQLPPHKSKQKEYFKFLLWRYAALRPENERLKEAVGNIDYKIVIQGLNAALNEAKSREDAYYQQCFDENGNLREIKLKEEITSLKAQLDEARKEHEFDKKGFSEQLKISASQGDRIKSLESELSTMREALEEVMKSTPSYDDSSGFNSVHQIAKEALAPLREGKELE